MLALIFYSKTQVITLTEDNFRDYRTKIVKFYAPWCGHCRDFAATFEELSKFEDQYELTFGEVDCTQYKPLCSQYNATSFPAIILFVDNNPFMFHGTRSQEEVTEFIESMFKPQFDYFYNEKEAHQEAKNKNYSIYFLLTSPTLQNEEFAAYRNIAKIFPILSQNKDKQLTVFRLGKEIQLQVNGQSEFDDDLLNQFMVRHNRPYLYEMGKIQLNNINNKIIIFIVANQALQHHQYALDLLSTQLSDDDNILNEYNLAILDSSQYDSFVEQLSINMSNIKNTPQLVHYDAVDNRVIYQQNMDVYSENYLEQIKQFTQDINDGKIKRTIFDEDYLYEVEEEEVIQRRKNKQEL